VVFAPEPAGTAIVFPGMGPSSYADLGKFIVTDLRARRLRRLADAALGYPLLDRYRTSGEGYSEYTQVAFLISCIALFEWAEEELGISPSVCSGPSFGSKCAVVHAGALPFQEMVLATAQLARCEEEYFRSAHQDVVTQSIARTPEPVLQEILAGMRSRNEWHDISCYIDSDFFMVSMRESSLEPFITAVRAAGGLPLYVMRPPMHSSAFGELRDKVANEVLSGFQFTDPNIPIIADQDGSIVDTGAGVRTMLLDGFVRPVRWPATLQTMKNLGVSKIYIAGPDTLFGRVRSATESFSVVIVNQRMAMRPKRAPKIPGKDLITNVG
jgi:[acyl-carrier-protein] S-malonyltransferase